MHRTSAACRSYGRHHPFCEACGDYGIQVHHIKTRKSGGSDMATNLLALCPSCHAEWHKRGLWAWAVAHDMVERVERALHLEQEMEKQRNGNK